MRCSLYYDIGIEQLYSSPSDRETEREREREKETIYNKHQNTIGTLDYQAVTQVRSLQNKLY